MGVLRRALICALAGGLTTAAPASAGDWCDVVFKDVAREADIVALARVETTKSEPATVRILDVLKGRCDPSVLTLEPDELDVGSIKPGDHLLLALDAEQRPVRITRGLGFCSAISVLPIRGGKLRARERVNYDSQREAMTLDELRDELSRMLSDAGSANRVSSH